MIPKECKRLAEVDFPIAIVGKHSLAEKARRMGTPHQLHLWWAWRPLAACRAMLMALLLPDPCDERCPSDFKKKAHNLLLKTRGHIEASDAGLRLGLLRFIGDYADWDLSSDLTYVEVARGLLKAAHPDEQPLVVDPFAGGGSIPLESLRLGCETVAADVNPVAGLILKAKLKDIPQVGIGIADELRSVGNRVKLAAERELGEFYPRDEDGAQPIAYLWARTVTCEQPRCGCEIPLIRSFWLSKKRQNRQALRYSVTSGRGTAAINFEIFRPVMDSEVPDATVSRARAVCPACRLPLAPDRVRSQLCAQSGGGDVLFDRNGKRIGGARLLAVVTVKPGVSGRQFRLPNARDYEAVYKAQERAKAMHNERLSNGLTALPDEPTPKGGGAGAGRAFALHQYGIASWRQIFTSRQALALAVLAKGVHEIDSAVRAKDLVGMCVAKLAERLNTSCDWMVDVECPGHLFTQQAVQTGWDFAEANPLSSSSGSFELVVENTANNVEATVIRSTTKADVYVADATQPSLPEGSASVWFTDPPYYDAIPYSDLSDFFYVWLRRSLSPHPLLTNSIEKASNLTPKCPEIVQDEAKATPDGKPKDKEFFEQQMTVAFGRGRKVLRDEGIGCVVFAHKTTEGWESLLSGITCGGWVITASWPILTERSARTRARESAALATSVHLVCRPRPVDAPVGDWADVLRELPKRVADWMERLQSEGIRGADLVFACIGPALEIFSRYRKVETADGREVKLAEYLEKVWEVVGRTALENVLGTAETRARNGIGGALEEDARLTALFLWTLQSTNGGTPSGAREKAAEDEEEIEGSDDTSEEEEEDTGEEARATKRPKGLTLIKHHHPCGRED